MAKLRLAGKSKKSETVTQLKNLKPGDGFRFNGIEFNDAMENAAIYMVVNAQPIKEKKVTIVSLDGQQLLVRDDDNYVIQHKIDVAVHPAEMI